MSLPQVVWEEMTPQNTGFMVLHSHPLGRIVRQEQDAEKRQRLCSFEFLVLGSCKKDSRTLGWPTDPDITPGRWYVVVKKKNQPSKVEGYQWDFVFTELTVIKNGLQRQDTKAVIRTWWGAYNLQEDFNTIRKRLQDMDR